ncbi:hypothetical protein XA68_17147 [Ophiocordyceps unilateralis]|uniref:Uncharacterized protein n=1 Tax=Ophiocordyceps unilateralis TaxID=268505 RepID=A0A2A9P598_OPHUN|nr:hypothetical protein XA68_17147 [Ophiocordyceps unilateralis]
MASASPDKLKSSMSSLKLHDADKTKRQSKLKKRKEVADSWEDEDESSSSAEDTQPQPSQAPKSPHQPSFAHDWSSPAEPATDGPPAKRPEKTDAVARRMIAAGLGLKVPKQTAEQSAYQKSIREQERKRRDQQRAEEQMRKEEAEKAKAAIWDD